MQLATPAGSDLRQRCREAVERGQWEQALALQGTSDDSRQLAELTALLHGAVLAPAETELPPERRAALCWQVHRLLLEKQGPELGGTHWLAVMEQQLVLHGAQLWRERIGESEEAGERALAMFLRVKELLKPCPAWVRLACLELRGLSPEQRREDLDAERRQLEQGGNDRDDLLVVQGLLAECCDRCCREALERGQWDLALERQEDAERLLRDLELLEPDGSQVRWEGYATLVIAIVAALQTVPMQARWRAPLQRMLRGYHQLPIEPPPWLAAVEQQLLGAAAQPTEPLQLIYEPDGEGGAEAGGDRFNLAALLIHSGAELEAVLEAALGSFLGERPGVGLVEGCTSLYRSIGVQWLQGEQLQPDLFARLGLAAEVWNRLGGIEQGFGEKPVDLAGPSLLIQLEATEVDLMRQVLLDGQTTETGIEGWSQADLDFWCERALACLCEIALWGDGVLWSPDAGIHWLQLPILQAITTGSGRVPPLLRAPELRELYGLMAGEEVLYVGPDTETVDRHYQEGHTTQLFTDLEVLPYGLRCLAMGGPGSVENQLAAHLEAVQRMQRERPIAVVVVAAGILRLPLCQALRRRLGLKCLGLGASLSQLFGVERRGDRPWCAATRRVEHWTQLDGP